MSVRIAGSPLRESALYDSTTGWAFGPVFEDEGQAQRFLEFAAEQDEQDVRRLSEASLKKLHGEFVAAEEEE